MEKKNEATFFIYFYFELIIQQRKHLNWKNKHKKNSFVLNQ